MQESFSYLDQFMDYFSGIRERSRATVREYRYDLQLFFRFLKRERGLVAKDVPFEEIPLQDIDLSFLQSVRLSDFYRFISWLGTERRNGPAARARRVSALRSFFSYLTVKLHVLESNPTAELEMPKQNKRLPRYLELDEAQDLLKGAAQSAERYSQRDYCILVLFLNCGLRLSELVGIDLPDIKGDTLRVVGKGNKERTVYLNGLAVEAIRLYLEERLPSLKDPKALFISRNRRRISQRAVENIVKKYLLQAGLDPARYSAHKLRHTAATLMYQYGQVDLRSLQQILGHESVATTEIYTHINSEMLHAAVEKNPLNELRKEDLQERPED